MNKLLTLLAVGFMMVAFAACTPPPAPTFDLPDGTYGYSLDLTDPMNPVPILQAVGIVASVPANVIFFSLDGSDPVAWDPSNEDDPNWANLMTLTGSIPYMDLSGETGDPTMDLTQLTSVGLLYFMGLSADPPMPGPATTTIKAIEVDPILGLTSEIASATYTIDPTVWNGDYTVVGHPPLNPMDPMTADTTLQMLAGLLSPAPAGGGFATIDGDLTITNLDSLPLALLYGCGAGGAPGCLAAITGDLVVTGCQYETTMSIGTMAALVAVGGSVVHCDNADDDPCNALTVNLCSKSVACATPPEPPAEWACDGANEATVFYTPEGPTLDVRVSGTVPLLDEGYTLIYYPDPWAVANGNLICLGSATSDATTGAISIPWTSNDIGEDLPIPADENTEAKLFLLPTANVNCTALTISWGGNICSSMFEVALATDRITYTYIP